MEDFIIIITNFIRVICMWFFYAIFGVLIGVISGWFVGLFFGDTILAIFAAIGIKGFAMWQIGAFLGFVSSFFRMTTVYNKPK